MKVSEKLLDDKDIETVPTFPSSEVVLKIEEIPPLEIFYSPQHKAIVKREIKKRKIDQSQTLVPGNAYFEVLWKGSTTTPTKELGRPTQFTGAYASTTIDKATEVEQFLEKEEKISLLEQSIEAKKKKIKKH